MFKHLTITDVSSQTMSRIASGAPIEDDKVRLTQLKLLIGRNKTIQNIARKTLRYSVFAERETKTDKTIYLHDNHETSNAQSFESPFGYNDDLVELNCAIKYLKQINDGFPNPSESKVLYTAVIETLSRFFDKHEVSIFLNFGINLAHIDTVLADRFPQVQFIGIDRSKLTKAFNEINYPSKDNLELIAGDIFDLLTNRDFGGGIFFHMRTLTFLPKQFNSTLLAEARESGFKYLVGFEPMGISRQTGKAYEFSLEPTASVAYRGHAFIHNYPELYHQAGYNVIESGLLKTDHAHEDYRIVYFIAEKQN